MKVKKKPKHLLSKFIHKKKSNEYLPKFLYHKKVKVNISKIFIITIKLNNTYFISTSLNYNSNI